MDYLLTRESHFAPRSVAYMADPPPGVTRQPDNPPNLHTELTVVGAVTTIVAFVAVCLRLFTRTYVSKGRLLADDWLLLVGMFFSLLLFSINFPFQKRGLGKHMWDLPVTDWWPWMSAFETASTTSYSLSIIFSKLSILTLYLQLSPERLFRNIVWFLIAVTCGYGVAYQLISIFGCRPVRATWDLELNMDPNTVCVNKLACYLALSTANIIIDLCTLLLPLRIVLPLQIPRRQKASIFLIFATGAFVCGVAIKRTLILQPLMVSPDYSWAAVGQFYWCYAEVNGGVVCASVPALKPFFSRYLPRFLGSQGSRGSSGGKGRRYLVGGSGRSGSIFNTVVEANKKRRGARAIVRPAPTDSYELQSADGSNEDLSPTSSTENQAKTEARPNDPPKPGAETGRFDQLNEDEVRLWNGNNPSEKVAAMEAPAPTAAKKWKITSHDQPCPAQHSVHISSTAGPWRRNHNKSGATGFSCSEEPASPPCRSARLANSAANAKVQHAVGDANPADEIHVTRETKVAYE